MKDRNYYFLMVMALLILLVVQSVKLIDSRSDVDEIDSWETKYTFNRKGGCES